MAIPPVSLRNIVCCCLVVCTTKPAEENDRGFVQCCEWRSREGSLWTSSSCLGANNRKQRGCCCSLFPEHNRIKKRKMRDEHGETLFKLPLQRCFARVQRRRNAFHASALALFSRCVPSSRRWCCFQLKFVTGQS